jgi:hypothetical protein
MNIVFHPRAFSEGVHADGNLLGTIDLGATTPFFMPSWNYRQLGLYEQAIVDATVENRIAVLLVARRLTS